MGNRQLYFLVLLALLDLSLAYNCDVVTSESRQSPIDINTSQVSTTRANRIVWSADYESYIPYDLKNNGYTMEVLQPKHSDAKLYITGGELGVTYYFKNIHFHWGTKNNIGSEHLINGSAFPMEMHVVHAQNTDPNRDTYAVVSVFFILERDKSYENRGLDYIVPELKRAAENRNKIIHLERMFLSALVPAENFNYYTYPGSSTISPYNETINWIVKRDPEFIGIGQLKKFREAAKIDKGLKDNYRCVQKLNGRTVREVEYL